MRYSCSQSVSKETIVNKDGDKNVLRLKDNQPLRLQKHGGVELAELLTQINFIQLERNGSRIKIHYEGYSSSYDEWCEDTVIVSLSPTPEQSTSNSFTSLTASTKN